MKRFLFVITLFACFLQAHSQESPTFYVRGLLDMWKLNAKTTQQRLNAYNALIPEDIRNNFVYSLGVNSAWYYEKKGVTDYTAFADDNYLKLCMRVDSLGIPFVINVGEIGNYKNAMPEPPAAFTQKVVAYYLLPSQVEKIFQNTKNCRGIESGENFWNYNSTTTGAVIDLLRICKKYDKKYILGEGGWGYDSFVRFINENYTTLKNESLGTYLIPTFKNTKPMGALVTQSSIMGAWLCGLTAGFGTWNDEWAWTYASFGNANEYPIYNKSDNNYTKYPYTHFLKSWLLTIAMGGDTGFLESTFFSRAGVAGANFAPYIRPFIKGLAEHHILPSKEAVIAKTKAMANPYAGTFQLSDGTNAAYTSGNLMTYRDEVVAFKPVSSATYADPYYRLYNNTYGIWTDTAYINTGSVTDRYYTAAKNTTKKSSLSNALLRELIPNSSRYGIIPLLPHPDAAASVPQNMEVVALSSYQTDQSVKDKFNSLYPPLAEGNEAWSEEIDNSFFVINSNENADIDQKFSFSLGAGEITDMSGVMPFQNILFGKREGTDDYWFQSNGYAVHDGTTAGQKYTCVIKPTTIAFKCKTEPVISVEDGKNTYVTKNWNADTKVMTLTINHGNGAVNFRISSSATAIHSGNTTPFAVNDNHVEGYVDISGEMGSAYRIYDINGRIVTSGHLTNTHQQIKTDSWSKGIYLVRMTNASDKAIFKIVINN